MLQLVGSYKEKFGKEVNKVVFLKQLSDHNFVKVTQRYFGNKETTLKVEGGTYIARPDRTAYSIGQLHIQFAILDKDNNSTYLTFNGAIVDGLSPQQIDNLVFDGQTKTALRFAASGGTALIMLIMAVGVGLAVGFIIGQNLNAWTGKEETAKTAVQTAKLLFGLIH